MSDNPHEFTALMQRVREGSEEAAQELLQKYGDHIFRVVRRKLHRKLRSKFDSSDFVQAVWASFFARKPAADKFDRPEALIAFLATLAQNKVVEAVRQRFGTQKHDVAREQSLEGSTAAQAAGLAARQPTPSQVATANEAWGRLLTDLPDHYQRILVLLREGHTHKEIAEQVGVNEKTIRRLIAKLKGEPVG
jgi:RNA polymerase sigma factor (sigma-70 family)